MLCFDTFISRACPECRQKSDYVCPSWYWVDTPEAKRRMFAKFHENKKQIECRNFLAGYCKFEDKCFYK